MTLLVPREKMFTHSIEIFGVVVMMMESSIVVFMLSLTSKLIDC